MQVAIGDFCILNKVAKLPHFDIRWTAVMRSRTNENVLQRLKVLPDHLLDILLLAIVVCDLVKLPEGDVVLVCFS